MSSFYDDASLVVIPSGYKTSKIYAEKPTDGSGDLTFTRASGATRVASNGLIEEVRTNLVLQSQTFENASWTKSGSSVTSNSIVAPNGTTTADTLNVTATAYSSIYNTAIFSLPSGLYTQSVYAKKGTKNFLYILDFAASGAKAWYNLNTGAVGTVAAGFTATMQDAGNGWYRCTFTPTSAATPLYFHFGASDTDNSFTPSSSGTIYIWGAQLETGDIATNYIPTTTAAVSVGPVSNVPRLDYTNSSCPRLLLEPQRTNVVTFSEQFNNAAWTKSGNGVGSAPVITANAAISPDGYQNADKIDLALNGGTGASDWSWVYQNFTATASQPQAASIYLKAATAGDVGKKIRVGFIGYVEHTLTADWTRVELVQTSGSTSSYSIGFRLRGIEATANSVSFFAYGAQLEQNAPYVSSYIPTLSTSVTRVADAASKTGISSLIGQTEGTMFVDFQFNGTYDSNGIVAMNVLAAGGNEAYIFITGLGQLRLELYVAGALQAAILTSIGSVGRKKIAFAYKANDFVGYMNGVQIGTDTSGTVGAMSTIYVGTYQSAGYANGNINQALLFKTRLSNSDLATLTTL